MIKYHIDSPGTGLEEFKQAFAVGGWAISERGPVTVRIAIDGEIVAEKLADTRREDVGAAFPQYVGSQNSGFKVELSVNDLQSAEHLLEFSFKDEQGNEANEVRKFRVGPGELDYHKYYVSEKEAEYGDLAGLSPCDMQFCIEFTDYSSLVRTMAALDAAGYSRQDVVIFGCHGGVEAIRELLSLQGKVVPMLADSVVAALRQLDAGRWVTLLRGGELIDRMFGQQLAVSNQMEGADALVFDHDHYRDDGLHLDPLFKPAWSYRLYLAKDYVAGAYCADVTALLKAIGKSGALSSVDCWRYELLLKMHEVGASIASLQQVLLSKPQGTRAVVDGQLGFIECVQAHLIRLGVSADVIDLGDGNRRVVRHLMFRPKVSIIVPTTGKMKYVKPCVDSILNCTDYDNFELVFIDNGRGENRDGISYIESKGIRVIERFEPFNWSKLNNDGVALSDGELLLFLNDDIEAFDSSWLTELVSQVSQNDVAAAGAMLIYPHGDIQHAGVFLVDHGGGARHWLQFLNPEGRLHLDYQKVVREVTATTGACLLIKRKVLQELGGFDEALPVVGNDVDVCLKIRKAGYHILWSPDCKLIHHESVSRKHVEYVEDERRMWDRWSDWYLAGDPFYNKNLSLHRTDCALRPPRKRKAMHVHKDENRGINLIGYIKAEMGVGEGARGVVRALETTSVCCQIINYEEGNPARMGDSSFSHLVTDKAEYPINVWHINADWLGQVMSKLPNVDISRSYNIAFWAWELPEFPLEWCGSIDLVDEIWVPSEFVAGAIRNRTNKPVSVFPHPVTKNPIAYLNRKYFNLPDSCCVFLTAYDVNSVRQRKNPEGAIEAFLQAFEADDHSVLLLVKINSANPDEIEYMQAKIGGRKNIRLMTNTLDRIEMDSLMNSVDCFVSLHRSEGFGLAIAEAMVLGKPVLATAWSGNIDFVGDTYPFAVNYTLTKLSETYGPYKKGQCWAEPDVIHAAQLMQRIASDRAWATEVATNEKIRVSHLLSPENIGKLMEKRLLEIESVYSII